MIRTPVGWEAVCDRCGEVFMPMDETDTVHIERVDGTPCGGLETDLVAADRESRLLDELDQRFPRQGRFPVALGCFEPHEDGCDFGDGTGTVCTCGGES